MRTLLLALAIALLVPTVAYAHLGGAPAGGEELRVVKAGQLQVELSLEPQEPIVGEPARLSFRIEDAKTGEPVKDSLVSLRIHHIEHEMDPLTAGVFLVPDGTFNLTYHFWDGAEHAVALDIKPKGMDGGLAEFTVGVTPRQPPRGQQMAILALFMATVIAGVVVGYGVGRLKA